MRRLVVFGLLAFAFLVEAAVPATAHPVSGGGLTGRVADGAGAALPGVAIELRSSDRPPRATVSGPDGAYAFEDVVAGSYQLSFQLANFATVVRRAIAVGADHVRQDAVLQLALDADVTVVARRDFTNLADVEDPALSLVGVAQAASQGAITARQLDVRPIMRQGEVLETVPGVIVTQHSGEGKANQYFLRGFNLDHGSDFAISVAGTPVNMPTHAHSQGYADINFLIPEIVAGVQFSKGPYFADQGDFATAGAATVTYATSLERPLVALERGAYGFSRALVAASPRLGDGTLLAALEVSRNSGPWTVPDAYDKANAVLRYSLGDAANGLALTYLGYQGRWNATEASPQRAIDSGVIDRFGTIDPSDIGRTSRHALALDWQRGHGRGFTRVNAYALRYALDLVSNFTFYLDDPVHGDQQEQVDRRWVFGGRVSHRRATTLFGRPAEHTVGLQVRADDIGEVGLYHTETRARLDTRARSSALVTSGGVYAQSDVTWAAWLRTTTGVRVDGLGARVTALDVANSGRTGAALASPKLSIALGPWKRTEIYANAGAGFHSNNVLGATLTRDARGGLAEPVTPLVRAIGAEIGVRTITIPRLQTTVSLWRLGLGSELVYNGDLGATEPGPASRRWGVEIANYYRPRPWLVLDADVSLSQARFAGGELAGLRVPEAVGTVVSGGVGVDGLHRTFAGVRLRYFGSRALVADDAVRSRPTTMVNLLGGYQLSRRVKLAVDVFNLLDASDGDIDYYFVSRLPGEPLEGVEDHHMHPVVPRSVRLATTVTF